MKTESSEYIPHRNLLTVSTFDNTDISNDNCVETEHLNTVSYSSELQAKQIKYEKQKQKIKGLKRQLQNATSQSDIIALKNSIYDELSSIGNTLSSLSEQNRCLVMENNNLKNVLSNKNNVIEEFQHVAQSSNAKFKQMGQINEKLKEELETANKTLISQEKIKKENSTLISSLKEIKEQLNEIESSYNKKVEDSNKEIQMLTKQIENLKTENEKISKQSEEVCNTNLSEIEMLHAQLNCLIKEKEILMREKERDHQEIIYYRRMFCDNENDIATKNVRINRKREEDMISLFKSKEEDYMKEITKLQNIIVDRENEVECIKEQLLSEIHALKLENEKLHYNIEVILSRKKETSKENDYLY